MNDPKECGFMRVVGRNIRPIAFLPSAELLREGALFNDETHRLTGHTTCIPQGIHLFKSHEDANRFDFDCTIKKIVKIAEERACLASSAVKTTAHIADQDPVCPSMLG